MSMMRATWTGGRTGTSLLICGLVVSVLLGCRRESRQPDERVLVVSATLTSTWVRNFNPFSPNALWPTQAGVYEPMMIYNTLKGEYVPWLATTYRWSADHTRLDVQIRQGVRWSDGRPLTGKDVAYTFDLLKKNTALDTASVWKRLHSVELLGSHRLRFNLKTVDFPALPLLLHQMIVPEHVWSRVEDPVVFLNPNPVGSGPYTEVVTFRTQLFELGLNPHYWQPTGHLAHKLRMPAYQGNDTVSLALVSGDIDWAGHNLPLIERTYVARDPEHFKYWFPPLGGMVFLYANTTQPHLQSADVRKAISQGINRARLVEVGMSGYTEPAEGTGLSPAYAQWRCCSKEAKTLTHYDPEAARASLKRAGCTLSDGLWSCQGRPMRLTLEVVNGWSDWIRTAQLIKQDLKAIGIEVTVKSYDFGAWFEHVQKGAFELSIGWSNEGPTPYDFYTQLAATKTVKPVGEAGPTNWHRFGDAEFDTLLDTFARTPAGDARRQLVHQMQRRFIEVFPAIPLFPNPSWGTYSTRHFEGFPHAGNPYAKLTPHANPERLLLLTTVRAKGGAQ